MLFELIKGLIKDLDGTVADEVHIKSFFANRISSYKIENFNDCESDF